MKSIFIVLLLFSTTLNFAQEEAVLLGRWSNDTLVASTAHNNIYNEIWGYAADGREYAIMGSTMGTHIFDVTDPSNPDEIHFIMGGTAGVNIIHRDYHDNKGYLYAVADEGNNSTLQIIDLKNLPESINVVYDSKEYIRRAHNIFIDPTSDIMYALICGGEDIGFTPIRLFDISNPEVPSPIADFWDIGGFGLSQVHDAYVRDNIAYMNCGPEGFAIADFTNPTDPILLASVSASDYPQAGYNHSGWLSEDGSTYYLADENHGYDMKIIDVSDLPNLEFEGFINADSENENQIPHNQVVAGNYLYTSYYFDGLQVYDISNPLNPVRAFYYDTSTEENTGNTYRGAWGVYPLLPSRNILVSDMQNGLYVFKAIDMPSALEHIDHSVELSVSPNPSNGVITVSSKDAKFTGNYTVYNLNGQVVDKAFSNELAQLKKAVLQLNIEAGMYMIEFMMSNGKLKSERIIIEN